MLNVGQPEACSPIPMLYHNHTDTGISEQLEKLRTALIESRCQLADDLGNRIATRRCIVLEPLHLPFQIFLLIGFGNARVESNTHCLLWRLRFSHNEGACIKLISILFARFPP